MDALSWKYSRRRGLFAVDTGQDRMIDIRPSHVFVRKLFPCREDLVIAEIGVHLGINADLLWRMFNPCTLFLIDSWHKHDLYPDSFEAYERVVRLFNENENVKIIRGFSQEVMPTLEENSFDFVYIDADHTYTSCCRDIVNAFRLVKIGGVVGGHDYGGQSGVVHPLQVEGKGVGHAVQTVLEGLFVYGDCNDFWLVVEKEDKRLVERRGKQI